MIVSACLFILGYASTWAPGVLILIGETCVASSGDLARELTFTHARTRALQLPDAHAREAGGALDVVELALELPPRVLHALHQRRHLVPVRLRVRGGEPRRRGRRVPVLVRVVGPHAGGGGHGAQAYCLTVSVSSTYLAVGGRC